MDEVSQNSDQKASQKRHKIHRTHPEVSCKIITFETIFQANSFKSAREITTLLKVPNSTMQTWRKQNIVQEAAEDEAAIFFATPTGILLLQKLTLAILYNNKCGLSGICGTQECLRNAGLDKYVATSKGALQEFWQRTENEILVFGKHWTQKLAEGMKHRKITVILDEMFRKRKPCLVAIEAVSNYILIEKFTEDRKAETWKKELENATKEFPVTIGQVVSDLCGAIRSAANSLGAEHSPDLFHGQYEISKATSGVLSSQERSAENSLKEAEEKLKKALGKPRSIIKETRKEQKQEQKETKKKRDFLKAKYEERKKRREETQGAKKQLGKIYHPVDLGTGKIQSPEVVAKKIKEQFAIIDKNIEEAGLEESCKDRVEKAKRAFALMMNFLKRFFIVFTAAILDLNVDQAKFFTQVVFPICYLKMIWRRLPKKEQENIAHLLGKLHKKLKKGAWPEEYKEALIRRGKELAETFQRSSSCVEGRNGVLSLMMHRFCRFSEKTMRVLSMVHNFGVRRKDGSTSAERFFEGKHAELFDHLVKNVRIPGKPQLQVRTKSRWAA